MSKVVTVVLDRFDGGMTNDARDRGASARIMKHLDDFTEQSALSVLPDNDATGPDRSANAFDTFRIQQFIYSNVTFFGLGVQSGTTKPDIYTKTGVADGAAWAEGNATGDFAALTALTGAASQTNSATGPTIFVLYQNYLYGLEGAVSSRSWWKYGDITFSPSWTRISNGLTNENVADAVVHSKDDTMYFIHGNGTLVQNRVSKLVDTTWSNSLIFQLYAQLASLCEYGNYLAIAANNPNGVCVVYLWDRNSSLAGISETIDWGSGTLKWISTIGGLLIGCSVQEPSGLSLFPNVVFKYYNGSEAVKFAEFTCTAATINNFRQRFNNQILFLAEMTINGTVLRGTWRVVKTPRGLRVSFDRLPRLDDTITTGKLYGFLQTGDYLHAACANAQDSDKYIVTKTGNTFGTTALYETAINPGMPTEDRPKKKNLLSVSALYDPLVANSGVILSYKVDSGSWTQIVNDTTDGSLFSENPGVAGIPFTSGRDFEFRVSPAGGATPVKVTGLVYKYRVEETLL